MEQARKIYDVKFREQAVKSMASGTISDQIAALTLSVQESPVHHLDELRKLVAFTSRKVAALPGVALRDKSVMRTAHLWSSTPFRRPQESGNCHWLPCRTCLSATSFRTDLLCICSRDAVTWIQRRFLDGGCYMHISSRYCSALRSPMLPAEPSEMLTKALLVCCTMSAGAERTLCKGGWQSTSGIPRRNSPSEI